MALFGRRKRRNELHCHACDKYVQFVIDQSLDGNHVLNCPNCGHEHCRRAMEDHLEQNAREMLKEMYDHTDKGAA